MKIYFGESSLQVQLALGEYDKNGVPDQALDDYELEAAGGFDQVMQKLTGRCVGLVPNGPLGEYNVVGILSAGCEKAEQSTTPKISVSNKTPNGRKYPGLIVDIPGGEFEMGTTCDGKDDTHEHDEHTSDGKIVRVKMPPFRLSKTEVTVGDYKAFLRETGDPTYKRLPNFPENKKGDDYPVVGLTLGEKIQFARYYGATLPTAAQIEYASKGSRHTDLYGTPIDKAVIWDNGYRMTAEVCGAYDKVTGRYERENDFGVCDLAGNVWETTSDGYDENFYDRMNKTDPRNLFIENRANYVELRGASFYNFARPARAANRFRGRPVLRYFYVGFHLAWPPDSKQ